MTDLMLRYERLCRGWWGLNGRGAIWLGADHLLHSASVFAVERYQRWYFRDVQALIARRTHARLVWNLVVGGGGLLFAFGATSAIVAATTAANSGDITGFIILASVLGVVALGMLRHCGVEYPARPDLHRTDRYATRRGKASRRGSGWGVCKDRRPSANVHLVSVGQCWLARSSHRARVTATMSSRLALQKCWHHAAREAVARCPECGRSFCRECVVEHGARIVCAGCLAKLSAASEKPARRWSFAPVWRAGAAVVGLILAWFTFFAVGQSLLSIPSEWHEGSVWQRTFYQLVEEEATR
jgi:hypothetical protein